MYLVVRAWLYVVTVNRGMTSKNDLKAAGGQLEQNKILANNTYQRELIPAIT